MSDIEKLFNEKLNIKDNLRVIIKDLIKPYNNLKHHRKYGECFIQINPNERYS